MKKISNILLIIGLSLTFLITASVLAQQAAPKKPVEKQQKEAPAKKEQAKPKSESLAEESEKEWFNPDYRPYEKTFEAINSLSEDYARNKLKLAQTNYDTGRAIIQKMREEVERERKESTEKIRFNEKWYWQEMDRKRQEEYGIYMKKREAKLAAVTYFTRAINELDKINNTKVRESGEFKEMEAGLYRDWVIQQYDIGNIPQCIQLLERYIALDPKYENEITPHKYLSSAYAFKEKVLDKYNTGSEQEKLYYKGKKNQHLLRSTEIKYGKNSPEYEFILDRVNRDEIIAISPR
ncbi:MAG: hypothetical protein OEZ22_02935 [Spirochaetia bacterium]|nr:hypothetical protein [Spirochaetia bacterium]